METVTAGPMSITMADPMGSKSANLADMAQLGLPVPSGFTITTEARRDYYRHNRQLPIARLATAQAKASSLSASIAPPQRL